MHEAASGGHCKITLKDGGDGFVVRAWPVFDVGRSDWSGRGMRRLSFEDSSDRHVCLYICFLGEIFVLS